MNIIDAKTSPVRQNMDTLYGPQEAARRMAEAYALAIADQVAAGQEPSPWHVEWYRQERANAEPETTDSRQSVS